MTTTVATLRLDDEAHRAFLGDRELVRATTALTDVGIIDDRWFSSDGLARGSRVHAASAAFFGQRQRFDEGLTFGDLPYWRGLLRFVDETGFLAQRVEQEVYDEAEGYAGRYDLFGLLPRLSDRYDDLIDLKTGHAAAWVALQTMGYARRARNGKQVRRWALELPGDGTYKLVPLNCDRAINGVDRRLDAQHERVFLSAVAVSRWKRGL